MDGQPYNKITHSNHITVNEIRCKCGCGLGEKEGDFKPEIAQIFDEIRTQVNLGKGKYTVTGRSREYLNRDIPINITCGCRCKTHNKAVGGKPKSLHLTGQALDLQIPSSYTKDNFYELCDRIVGDKGAVIKYKTKNIIHIDSRGKKYRGYL